MTTLLWQPLMCQQQKRTSYTALASADPEIPCITKTDGKQDAMRRAYLQTNSYNSAPVMLGRDM